MYINHAEQVHRIPLVAPVDTGSTTSNSDIVDTSEAHWIQFEVNFGVITGDTAVITVEECDDTTPSNSTAIAFKYRKSSAVGTDSLGDITAATTSGVTVAATDDNKLFIIDVDPAALTAGYPYLRVVTDPGASMSVCLLSVNALVEPRYIRPSNNSMVD